MEPSPDELAGIVDLFGGLSRADVRAAVENLAARTGTAFDPDAVDAAIDGALREYYLLAVPDESETILAAGPAALPVLPEHGEDLPHMMDVDPTELHDDRLSEALSDRLADDVDAALDSAETERLETLLDVCYAAEAWTGVDVEEPRERLLEALEED